MASIAAVDQWLKCTCVEICYLREVDINMLQLFVPFPPLSSSGEYALAEYTEVKTVTIKLSQKSP